MDTKELVSLVAGVSNKHSIGGFIARGLAARGATVAVACESRHVDTVTELLAEDGIEHIFSFDAGQAGDSARLTAEVGRRLGRLDSIVHCPVWTNPAELKLSIWDTSKENCDQTMQVSVWSLKEMVRGALPYLHRDSSVVAMTFPPGSQTIMKGYGLMGVAKSALDELIGTINLDLGPEGKGICVGAGATAVLTGSSMAIPVIKAYIAAVAKNAPQGPVSAEDIADVVGGIVLDGTAKHQGGHIIPIDNGHFLLGAMAVFDFDDFKKFVRNTDLAPEEKKLVVSTAELWAA